MVNPEVVPIKFREPFDLFSDVDHSMIAFYTKNRLIGRRDITSNLQSSYDQNVEKYYDFLSRLIERGRYLEAVNDDLEFEDPNMQRLRSFNAGVALATSLLDTMSYEMGLTPAQWRQRWTALPPESDFPRIDDSDNEMTAGLWSHVGEKVLANGLKAYKDIEEQEYKDFFVTIDELYGSDAIDSDVFKSTFGHVFLFGQKVIYSFSHEERLDQAVIDSFEDVDLEAEAKTLVSKRERRLLRRMVKIAHGNIGSK